jgi:uncharacterized membrane protein
MKSGKRSLVKELLSSKGFALDLIIIIVLSSLSLLAIMVLPQGNPIRIVFGILFLIFFPGYCLVSALWPRRKGISGLERVALSVGLSIAIVPLVGFTQNYAPWGINLYSMMLVLFILVIIFSCLAYFRRIKVPIEERFVPTFAINKLQFLARNERAFVALLMVLFVLALSVFIFFVLTPTTPSTSTAFYLLDENRSSSPDSLPRNLTVGENASVIIGILSQEPHGSNFTVEVMLQNLTDNSSNLIHEYSILLEKDQENETKFTFNIDNTGNYRLQFYLYKIDEGKKVLIRDLHLWLLVK